MLELQFVAPDVIRKEVFGDHEGFDFEFLGANEYGPGIATMQIEDYSTLGRLLEFLFGKNTSLHIIFSNAKAEVIDLTGYRGQCLTAAETENRYNDWLALSGRENTQDEFADLVCIAGFVHTNSHKKHLLLRIVRVPVKTVAAAATFPMLKVTITRFISKDNPFFIECRFMDALGKEHIIHEKVPVITHEELDEHSTYPRPGFIACEIMEQFPADGGSEIVLIDTSKPWGIETTEGETIFEVDAAILIIP